MKKLLSFVLTVSMLVSLCVLGSTSVSAAATQWNGQAAAAFAGGGDGTAANPYKIGTAGELKRFADIVNGGQYGVCGTLTADITLNVGDVSGCDGVKADGWFDWTPICPSYVNPYSGTFDGAGHFVSGIYYNSTNFENGGFFGNITGSISNLGIVNSYMNGVCVGGVCGYNINGTITGCYNTGTVTGTGEGRIGGVCGSNLGTITGCYNAGAVIANGVIAGGICGGNGDIDNSGTVTGCFNTGNVSGTREIGGVCGSNNHYKGGVITNCYYLEGTASKGIYTGSGEAEMKTADEMKTQAFVDLLNANGGDFTFYIGKLPLQSWQPDPNIYNIDITYTVIPVYTVTIPAEVTLGGTATVEAENVILEQGKQLEIAITGTSGDGNAFTVSNGKTATLIYQVTDSGSNNVSVGGTVLTVNPATAATGSTTLKFSNPTNTVKFSGIYTGTVTFTLSVTDE